MKQLLSILSAFSLALGCASMALADEAAKLVILVVSFGTSDNCGFSIGALEADIVAAFPDYEVRRAFTAQTIIDKLVARDGLEIENVTEAIERLA